MKTRVFCSSIFFRAPSVLRGWTMTLCSSSRGAWATDLRGYLGARDSCRVLGRQKVVEVRTLVFLWECTWRKEKEQNVSLSPPCGHSAATAISTYALESGLGSLLRLGALGRLGGAACRRES